LIKTNRWCSADVRTMVDDVCRTEVGDWHWDGLPGGELASLKASGSDGVIRPAIRIWEEKIKVVSGVAGRAVVQGGAGVGAGVGGA
jgi:hypothetical protein